jgi:hypothetical protein
VNWYNAKCALCDWRTPFSLSGDDDAFDALRAHSDAFHADVAFCGGELIPDLRSDEGVES